MRGRFLRLSPARRIIIDLTALSVPSVPVQRVMHLGEVAQARAAARERRAWTAIFGKAFALVAAEMPELRRAYIKLPSPRLFEYPASTMSLAVEREHEGEAAVMIARLTNPAGTSLAALSAEVRRLKQVPIASVKDFRRALAIARWPTPIRRAIWWLGLNIGRQRGNYFGTYSISVYSALGAESLHPKSPLTSVVNYGVIAADGTVTVRIMYDHRVLDGAAVARALARMEEKLSGPILAELRTLE